MSNPNPGRLNIYVCDDCGLHIVTKDVDQGTTPFIVNCQCTPRCLGKMYSSMYRVWDPKEKMRWTHEWYKPSVLLNMSPAVLDHVANGGLLLRARLDNPQMKNEARFTHLHLKRQTKYRVIGDVRLQISSLLLPDGKGGTIGDIHDLDGMMFTLYQGEDGVYSARHPAEFNDGRFQEIVDHG